MSTGGPKDHFDNIGEDYLEQYKSASGILAEEKTRRLNAAISMAGVSASDDVLNVGVGAGQLFRQVESGPGKRVGVDISQEMVRVARNRTDGSYVGGEIQQMPFRAGAFDVVFCLGVVGYLPRGGLQSALTELGRVLVPNGTLILSFANHRSPFRWLRQGYYKAMEIGKRVTGLGDPMAFDYHCYDPETVCDGLRSEGFDVSATRYLTYSTGIWNTALNRRLYRELERRFQNSHKAGPMAMTWLLSAER